MGEEPYRIVFRSEARTDLDHEYRYSKRRWGAEHAKQHFATLRAAIAALATHPYRHGPMGARETDWRILSTVRGLRVAYRVVEPTRTVEVYAILGRDRFHAMAEAVRKRAPSKEAD